MYLEVGLRQVESVKLERHWAGAAVPMEGTLHADAPQGEPARIGSGSRRGAASMHQGAPKMRQTARRRGKLNAGCPLA